MEDMARLALVEQSVRDVDKFIKILYELLRHINHILDNPHEYDLRNIKSDILKDVLKHDTFGEYMRYIGFETVTNSIVYPKENSLSNLRMAQAAIERKINFCSGPVDEKKLILKSSPSQSAIKKNKITPVTINAYKPTYNPLLLKIVALFNKMLVYEDEELQALAREHIPIVTLQLMALDRVREQQKKLKSGEIKGHDMPFDIALLMELISWFKYKFFTWVDKPACDSCGGPTRFTHTIEKTDESETYQVEVYRCNACGVGGAQFPRHNAPRTLLRTRRGRCGEWANCFTLLCRALGYDTRFIYDVTDHVWCEVFDFDSNKWLHVDPCEGTLNAPLTYCHGWKKELSYVIAVSKDDLQDVSWRYTMNHKEVLKRRNMCDEDELVACILALRQHRQNQVSEARRKYLAKRNVEELVQLMVERQPSDYESHGRISGSRQWRMERGEIGTSTARDDGHTFEFSQAGVHTIRYYPALDVYRVSTDDVEQQPIRSWSAGVHHAKNVFRKVENDWRMVYLAREEGESEGTVSWRLAATEGMKFSCMSVRMDTAVYENGNVDCTVQFDDQEPVKVVFGKSATSFRVPFTKMVLRVQLSGGVGDVGWQHAQILRGSLDGQAATLDIMASLHTLN